MPTLILSMEIKTGKEEGMTSFLRICHLFAPMERRRSSLFSSVAMKPLSMLRIVTMSPMSTVMKTMALLPVPHQMMMRGPRAILGKALRTTR